MPAVSVVIPVHDGERYVAAAVRSALDQQGVEVEVVVVDDASTDGTRAVLRQFGGAVRVVEATGRNAGKARNAGVRATRAEWIAFLDADDVWLPHKLRRQLDALTATGATACLGGYRLVDASLRGGVDVLPSALAPRLVRALTMEGYGLGMSTLVVRRDTFATLGGFDGAFTTSDDLELLLRLAATQLVAAVCEVVALHREHAGPRLSRDLARLERDMTQLLDAAGAPVDRSRGLANLHAYLAVRTALQGRPASALRHVRTAAAQAPLRLVMHPAELVVRRGLRRVRGRWPAHRCGGIHVFEPVSPGAWALP